MQKLFLAIVALFALLYIIGLSLPRVAHVQASVNIDANPATIFVQLNTLRRVPRWYPGLADPETTIEFSGPDAGVGATLRWGGALSGSGVQTITDSRPYEHVRYVMNPGEDAEAQTWIDIERNADGSTVTQHFETDYSYNAIGRYMGLLVQGVFRRDLEAGLSNLKTLAENLPRADFSDIDIEQMTAEARDIAYIATSSLPETSAKSEALGAAYRRIVSYMSEHGLQFAGSPLSISRAYNGTRQEFDAAIPVSGANLTAATGSEVKLGKTYAGPALRASHIGSYASLHLTHSKLASYLAAHGLERNGSSWEVYVSDPSTVAEAERLTYVFYPLQP